MDFMDSKNKQKTVVVVGAGFAGAAIAFHLTRLGMERVFVLEREKFPGMHASGKNAAMIRQVVPNKLISDLARGGAAFLRNLPLDWPVETKFEQNGSFFLASKKDSEKIQQDGAYAKQYGTLTEWWPIERIIEFIPIIEGSPARGGLWCPTDGVVDIHSLMQGYLRSAVMNGAELKFSSTINNIVVHHGRVCAVQTESEEIPVDVVINAAGAWAPELGRLAGTLSVPLTPYSRHLFVTKPLDWIESKWPIVWDISQEIYFRPESGGLLLCPCDEEVQDPNITKNDPLILNMLAEKVSRFYPRLSDLPILRSWSGLRTLTPDRQFLVGWDPCVEGFFWLAGLGGHGVTVSYSVGLLAASLIVEGNKSQSINQFSPSRFY